jgi:hypothetical protein
MSDDNRWLDDENNVKKIYRGVWVMCAVLLLIEPLVHLHPHFELEGVFGFYGFYGFIACVALVLAAKVLRMVLMRPENYYDEPGDNNDGR